jgi:5-dehydro-4-deoxyglucarate dehydratase
VRIGVVVFMRHEFWPDVLQQLAELPNVVGFFPPLDLTPGFYSGIARAVTKLVPDRLLWIAENEPAAVISFPLGAQAYSTAAAALVPEASREFWRHGISGKIERMSEVLKTRIEPVLKIRTYKPGYGISGIKMAMEVLGRAGGPVRPPGTQVLAGDRAGIAAILRGHPEVSQKIFQNH